MLIDSKIADSPSNTTIFEPASGHGNFGIEILNHKFNKVVKEMQNEKISNRS